MKPAPPKVLHVSHTALVSGAEHSLLDLVSELDTLTDVRLAAPNGDLLDRACARGIATTPMRRVDATFKADARAMTRAAADAAAAARTLSGALRRGRRDVVHVNSVRATLFAGPVARAHRLPIVMHVRDVLPDGPAGDVVRRGTSHLATAIAANSRYVADAFCDGLPARLAAKVTVVDNPIDLDRFVLRTQEVRRDARRAIGITDTRPVLAIVGQITSWKGHDIAIRALADVRARYPDAVLLVVGEVKFASPATTLDNVAYREDLERLAVDLGLPPDAVRYLGERDDVPGILAASDLLLAPSTLEPFGRSLIEAMAVGTPVLATREGGPPEFIETGRTGWLLDPQAAAAWAVQALAALDHPGMATEVGRAAAASVRRRFSRDRHAAAMLDLFQAASA